MEGKTTLTKIFQYFEEQTEPTLVVQDAKMRLQASCTEDFQISISQKRGAVAITGKRFSHGYALNISTIF